MTPDAPSCIDGDCHARPTVEVLRGNRRTALPVCDTHAHVEVLTAERYRYDLTIRPLSRASSSRQMQLPAG